MCAFALFLSVDPSLGRVEYSLFSDQTLLEMLFEGFDDETKKKYKDNDGIFRDVCEWSCIKCDDNARVIEIDLDGKNLSGSLELCYVPPKVEFLIISSCGTSKLSGSVDLEQLPDRIYGLSLSDNQLTGELDLTRLPERMHGLSLEKNQLTGEINLSNLPDEMDFLNLESNHFTGEIDFTHLPGGMKYLSLENNQFTGSLVMKRLPHDIRAINVRKNFFNAIAVVDSQTRAQIQLDGSGVTSVVDENGKELDNKRFFE